MYSSYQDEMRTRKEKNEEVQLVNPTAAPEYGGSSASNAPVDDFNPGVITGSPHRRGKSNSSTGSSNNSSGGGTKKGTKMQNPLVADGNGPTTHTVIGKEKDVIDTEFDLVSFGGIYSTSYQAAGAGKDDDDDDEKSSLNRGGYQTEQGLDELIGNFGARNFGGNQKKVTKHWLIFQCVGWVLLCMLYWSESSNQAMFESKLAQFCTKDPESGICIGPDWKQILYKDVSLGSGSDESFQFVTKSQPPTALVVVDPYTEKTSVVPKDTGSDLTILPTPEAQPSAPTSSATHYRIRIDRTQPYHAGSPCPTGNCGYLQTYQHGAHAFSIKDLSDEAKQAGSVTWRVSIAHRIPARKPSRYRIYVQDVSMDGTHLSMLSEQAKCAFEPSWKKFNEKHQGKDEENSLVTSEWIIQGGILVSAVFIGLIYYILQTERNEMDLMKRTGDYSKRAEVGKVNSKLLAYLQVGKFIGCDYPVQMALVSYFLGWYDKAGMRCQLCLFDQTTCTPDTVFHFVNLATVVFILTSAVVTSLLLLKFHADKTKTYTEDEKCLVKSLQLGAVCLATLPFSTALMFVSRDQLLFPTVWYVAAGIPCTIGWLSLLTVICYPFLCMMDDDRLSSYDYEYTHGTRRY